MLDGFARRLIDPALDRLGAALAARGVSADALTFLGLAFGVATVVAVAAGAHSGALILFAVGRLLDGLDGAVGRATRPTDRGGFIDIVFDFVLYGGVPLGFALAAPATNALPAAVLLFTFYVNGASVLAFAAVAAKRGMVSLAGGFKSIYFSIGLAEGTETIIAFVAMMLLPARFWLIAYAFAGLTAISAVARVALAWRVFREDDAPVD
jgi:phosphatidylglycerophosphate synthase